VEQAQFLKRQYFQSLIDVSQLPIAVHDQQLSGKYQLNRSQTQRSFAWANGPQALKPLLFSAREVLWSAKRDAEDKINFVQVKSVVQKIAVIGVRSCDLAAMQVQDQVFLEQQYQDENYQARREALFTVAVNCSHPAETCFCVSTGDGPTVKSGYDLLLTELDDGFLITAGSEAGQQLLVQLLLDQASGQQHFAAGEQALHAEQV